MDRTLPEALREVVGLIEALSCGASVMDRDGRVIAVNRRMCEMMARPRHEIEGRLVEDFYTDPDDRQHVRRGIENFDSTRETEFHLQLPDGTRRPIMSSAKVLGDAPPLSGYRVVTMIDITAQKRAEDAQREHYTHIVELSDTVMAQALELKAYSKVLEERVRRRTEELHQANLDAVYMLAVASEAKDEDTGKHVRRIQRYSRALAHELGLPPDLAEDVGYASILHDVGKMHVPDHILKKPGPLTDDERGVMQMHTLTGERIVSGGPFFDRARRIARWHHENWDGTGYPDRIGGDKIPLEARIVHLADVYDALVHKRVYKDAWPAEEAAKAIREQRGRMFDPQVVGAFEKRFGQGAFADE